MLDIEDYIRIIPDFPKEGIIFKDITPLLASPEASSVCVQQLLELIDGKKIDNNCSCNRTLFHKENPKISLKKHCGIKV